MDVLWSALPEWDKVALVVFLLVWLGYGAFMRRFSGHSINAHLPALRVLWMRTMIMRDNRVTDASLIGLVVHSATFFASTSLIGIGALLGALTGVEKLQQAISGLTVSVSASTALLEMKVLLPLVVLVHGLFKLTLVLRELNYTLALMGAEPPGPLAPDLRNRIANEIGGMLSAALNSYNTGIRSYYFALVGIAWLAGPAALVAATLFAGILMRRQFSSVAHDRLISALPILEMAHDARS